MGWILLFLISFILIFGFIAVIFSVTSESDEKVGESGMTKNQVRAMAWALGFLICILALAIEYFVVIRGSDKDDDHSGIQQSEQVQIVIAGTESRS